MRGVTPPSLTYLHHIALMVTATLRKISGWSMADTHSGAPDGSYGLIKAPSYVSDQAITWASPIVGTLCIMSKNKKYTHSCYSCIDKDQKHNQCGSKITARPAKE